MVPDINSLNGLQTVKSYDNGVYSKSDIKTCHPNFVYSVIMGKRGWGLWIKQWSQGIGEGTFTKYEILLEFEKRNIVIPKQLFKDFENNIWRERNKKCNL